MLAQLLLGAQLLLALYFCFFGFYNYYYGIASLFKPQLKKVQPSSKKVAVVIVCYNEHPVIADTIKAAEKLTYPNKVIIVGDDSADGVTFPLLQTIAQAKGCAQLRDAGFIDPRAKVYESGGFVLFHRPHGRDLKGGHLKELESYLLARGFEYMYLLDADWWPQHDAIERCLEVLEADDRIAFVQTRRHSYHDDNSFLQRCLAMNEDGSSLVDLAGRQVAGDPILFGGCCAMFRLKHLSEAGGFTPHHLTEDIDLTNKLYLAGFKGVYLDSVANEGEVPPHYHAYRKQQEHWAAGSARTFKEHFWPVVTSAKLSFKEKLGLLRQNSYYTIALAIHASIILAFVSVGLVVASTDSFQAVLYRYYLQQIAVPYSTVMFAALASNFIHPLITAFKRRKYVNFLFIPYTIWASWSILHTYAGANTKGLLHPHLKLDWFHTPKTNKKNVTLASRAAHHICLINAATLAALLFLYWLEWTMLGWLDIYAFFWVPALMVGTFLS
jgi:cellulose synthase/poly-beta-1,6-N-acetylglucosamine synthase-like glycosyltransferase